MPLGDLSLKKILDSRGNPTIEVMSGADIRAQVPAGKSRGSLEASVLEYPEAMRALETIRSGIGGKTFNSVRELDQALLALDGTSNKRFLGGNVMLAVSLVFARILAASRKVSLWRALREEFFPAANDTAPRIFANLINGGEHAKNDLDIQEYMVVVEPTGSMAETVGTLTDFYRTLGAHLREARELEQLILGDEGGYSLDFADNFEPIATLQKLITEHGLPYSLALDAAANSFYRETVYSFDKKRMTAEELAATYARYFAEADKLLSIEDPFEEKDPASFAKLRGALPLAWVVGDDLTVTNPKLIEARAKEGAINAVIIKANQIGTVSETCDAITAAQKNGVKVILSHRSAETADNFLVEFARASGADAVKIGAPARERLLKYDELISLYDDRSV